MGFEERVPPLPSREAEMHMMHKLEESWLNQHYLKYYMNEDLRRPKMAFAQRQNNVRREFITNFMLYGFVLIPITLLCRKFIIYHSPNIPATYAVTNYLIKNRTAFETRVKSYNKLGLGVWLSLTYCLSYWSTNFEPTFDQSYKHMTKVHKML